MCAVLYLVSEQPLSVVERNPDQPTLTVRLVEAKLKRVILRHFPWASAVATVEVGGLCSCYFGPEPWPLEQCDSVFTKEVRERGCVGYRALGDYLWPLLSQSRLALYLVFERDERVPVTEQQPVRVGVFAEGEKFPLKLNEFCFITA